MQKGSPGYRNTKRYEDVSCLNIVKAHNGRIDGIDVMASLIGYYKILMTICKWTTNLFCHILDYSITNAYVLYHRINGGKNISSMKV